MQIDSTNFFQTVKIDLFLEMAKYLPFQSIINLGASCKNCWHLLKNTKFKNIKLDEFAKEKTVFQKEILDFSTFKYGAQYILNTSNFPAILSPHTDIKQHVVNEQEIPLIASSKKYLQFLKTALFLKKTVLIF